MLVSNLMECVNINPNYPIQWLSCFEFLFSSAGEAIIVFQCPAILRSLSGSEGVPVRVLFVQPKLGYQHRQLKRLPEKQWFHGRSVHQPGEL